VRRDPLVAAAPPRDWRAWLVALIRTGRVRLGSAALVLAAAIAAGAGLLVLFGTLADEVFEGDTMAVDQSVYLWLRRGATPAADNVARLVSAMGSEVVGALLVAFLISFAWRRRWGAAVSLGLVTVGAQLLNNVLKDHFRRVRPAPVDSLIPAQTWSFPSGHAMVSAAFYLFLAYLGWRLLRGRARVIVTVVLLALVLLIGLSRMYLGAHYLTDVVAGYLAGALWTEAVIVAGHVLPPARGRGASFYRRKRSQRFHRSPAIRSGHAAT
jgi:undecaprenyl-diphosphatase